MKTSYSTRVKTGAIGLVMLVSLVNTFSQLKNSPRDVVTDPVTQGAKRFAPLKQVLPRYGAVGYVNDAEAAEHDEQSEVGLDYAQYELAPLVVDKGSHYQFVIGDFRDPGNVSRFASEMNIKLIRDFGNGLVLFGESKK